MKRIIIGILAGIGGTSLVLALFLAIGLTAWLDSQSEPEELPDSFVLTLRINGDIPESVRRSPLEQALFREVELSLLDYVDLIDRARDDARVTGLVADVTNARLGPGQAQEIRDAVFRFRASGKPTTAFAESFEGGNAPYYLATAFDQIWMQPSGIVGLTGVSLEIPLAGSLLEAHGVRAEFEQRHEFKGALTSFTDQRLPEPIRQNLTQVAESLYAQIVEGIAGARKLSVKSVSTVIDRGPHTALEAASHGLIDKLGYNEDVLDSAGSNGTISEAAYFFDEIEDEEGLEATEIALLHIDGDIRGGDAPPGFGGSQGAHSRTLVKALQEIEEDEDIQAIILRISSPGGSYIASDTIRDAIQRLKDKGRLVVASFGDVAASGGYFAALPADHIIAQPGSLTGSVGAVGGKFSVGRLLEKFDVSVARIEVGTNAGMFSPTRPFSERERERMARILDSIYDDFTSKVAEARRLTEGEVDAAARGRAFTGEDAQQLGLVDLIGGYAVAKKLVRQSLNLTPSAPLELVPFPKKEGSLSQVLSMASSLTIARLNTLLNFKADHAILARSVLDEINVRQGVQARAWVPYIY